MNTGFFFGNDMLEDDEEFKEDNVIPSIGFTKVHSTKQGMERKKTLETLFNNGAYIAPDDAVTNE